MYCKYRCRGMGRPELTTKHSDVPFKVLLAKVRPTHTCQSMVRGLGKGLSIACQLSATLFFLVLFTNESTHIYDFTPGSYLQFLHLWVNF